MTFTGSTPATAGVGRRAEMTPGVALRRRVLDVRDPILAWSVRLLALLALGVVALMLLETLLRAAPLFAVESPAVLLFGVNWDPSSLAYGGLSFIYGTLITSVLALVFAVPLALGAALLINEYLPKRVGSPLAYAIELLAAVPSVVYGFWGVVVLVPALAPLQQTLAASPLGAIPLFAAPTYGPSYLAAGLILAIMILPIATAVSRDSLAATPRLQREAALALGATHWETIRHVTLPFARGGILAGVILALSRAIGETIAVLFVIGNQPQINLSMLAPGYTLPSVIASEFAEANQPFHSEALIALGIVLFLISFAVNVAARWVVGRFEARAGGADVR
jgi:phosphate transport system permease protein